MNRDDIKELVCRDCKGLSGCHGNGDGFTACSVWQTAEMLDSMGMLTEEVWDKVRQAKGCCSTATEGLVKALHSIAVHKEVSA